MSDTRKPPGPVPGSRLLYPGLVKARVDADTVNAVVAHRIAYGLKTDSDAVRHMLALVAHLTPETLAEAVKAMEREE